MAIDTPIIPPESCTLEGDMWISIYDIPNKQRATFYPYADANGLIKKIVVDPSDNRSDFLGMVDGVRYFDYHAWVDEWDGTPVLPSMQAHDGLWYTLERLDRKLLDPKLTRNDYFEYQMLWNKLQHYMLHPFRHTTASITPTSKVWTWYELESDMLSLKREVDNGAHLKTLLDTYINLGKFLTDGIMLSAYNYTRLNNY